MWDSDKTTNQGAHDMFFTSSIAAVWGHGYICAIKLVRGDNGWQACWMIGFKGFWLLKKWIGKIFQGKSIV